MCIMDAQTCCLIARMGARLVIVAVEQLRSLHTLTGGKVGYCCC